MSDSVPSATHADFSREQCGLFTWNPGRQLLRTIRSYQRIRTWPKPLRGICSPVMVLLHRFWSMASGADIPLNSLIGGGLLIPHPNGVVIHPYAQIGPNCLFFQQVTIGEQAGGIPEIGGHVDVGAGAKILGAVKIGDHARIGANAVVLRDVPPGATAIGIPARILERKDLS